MDEKVQFDEWCKKLALESGLSYQLVFKPHLRQIKNNWNAFNDEIALNINEVMLALLNHNLTDLLIQFVQLLENKMQAGKLISIRLRMFINCGIAFNMQNRIEESEQMYLQAMESIPGLIAKDDEEANNLIGSIYYNYARLKVSKGERCVDELLKTAIKSFEKGGYKPGLASCYSLQAVLLPDGKHLERIKLFLKAAELNKQTKHLNDYAMRLANVGMEFVYMGEHDKGVNYLNRALEINQQNASPHHLGMNYLMLAESIAKKGDAEKAHAYFGFALRELERAKINSYAAEVERVKQIIDAAHPKNKV